MRLILSCDPSIQVLLKLNNHILLCYDKWSIIKSQSLEVKIQIIMSYKQYIVNKPAKSQILNVNLRKKGYHMHMQCKNLSLTEVCKGLRYRYSRRKLLSDTKAFVVSGMRMTK